MRNIDLGGAGGAVAVFALPHGRGPPHAGFPP